jgi:PTH1 family peptidyl-tRNA hydrolase
MKVVIGLGNPGLQYKQTRHNLGFMVVEALGEELGLQKEQQKFQALVGETSFGGQKVLLVKPQTYMNLSGVSVRQMVDWYKLELEQILVVYDDLALPLGQLRLRAKGSAGGHNGIKSIIQHLGTETFPRLKVGIDRPLFGEVSGYVLGRFSEEERKLLPELINRASQAIQTWLGEGILAAMNKYN